MPVRLAKEAARFDKPPGLSFDTRRKLGILKQGIVLPAPSTPGAAAELNTIATRLQSSYGKGKGTLDGKPMSGNDLEEKLGTVRAPSKLRALWVSWLEVGVPMKTDSVRKLGRASCRERACKPGQLSIDCASLNTKHSKNKKNV